MVNRQEVGAPSVTFLSMCTNILQPCSLVHLCLHSSTLMILSVGSIVKNAWVFSFRTDGWALSNISNSHKSAEKESRKDKYIKKNCNEKKTSEPELFYFKLTSMTYISHLDHVDTTVECNARNIAITLRIYFTILRYCIFKNTKKLEYSRVEKLTWTWSNKSQPYHQISK